METKTTLANAINAFIDAEQKPKHEVLAIYAQGEFKQYLAKSEIRYISQMIKAWGEITVKSELLSNKEYKIHFGK